ncbi:unnamed protein product [Owenia fusiformis]|uniref:Uncharacterized protein n=1 Tax=Owenia fusiformis TaxID=6347 RepID=A0A8J1UHS7_OWEFU|nr:unnamed protein product [Owenia fusiformis]
MSEIEPDPYSETANELVDEVLNSAIIDVQEQIKLNSNNSADTTIKKENHEYKDIQWLTLQEFTIEKGDEKINEFLKTWEFEGSWLHCCDYLGADKHEFDTRYRYRVRWSIPTRRKPIPRATACVYFTFQVSKIKPKSHPVEVFYVFETNRLVHRPGQSRFRETWLKDIIESKVLMMRAVDF